MSLDKEMSCFWVMDLSRSIQIIFAKNITSKLGDATKTVSIWCRATLQWSVFMKRIKTVPKYRLQRATLDEVVNDYLDLNLIKLVTTLKFESFPKHYYLPHYAVIKRG